MIGLSTQHLQQVVLKFQNPDLEEESVGSKHERAWRELAADLLEEVLEKGQQGEEGEGGQPTFCVDDACTIVVTDMCVAFVVGHLQDEGTDLGSYKRTLNFLQLDVDKRDAWQALPPYMEGSRHSQSKAEDEEDNVDDINGGEGEDGAGGGYELGNTRGRGEEGAGGEEGSEELSEEGGAVRNGASTSQHPAKKQRGSSAAANLEKGKSQSAAAAKKAKAQSAKGVAAKKSRSRAE